MIESTTSSPEKTGMNSGETIIEQQDTNSSNQNERKRRKPWIYDTDFEQWVHSLPKIELHVHFDGSFDPLVLHKHLQSTNTLHHLPEYTILPWDNSQFPIRKLVEDTQHHPLHFHSLCTCHGKRSLQAMIKCFEIFLPIVRGNLTLLEQLAYDFCQRQASQNILYTEVRYNPHLLAKHGSFAVSDQKTDPRPVIEAMTKGFRRGELDYGITVNQILCCITWRPDWAQEIVDLAKEYQNNFPCAVVGVDIAAGEEHFDAQKNPHLHEPHYKAFQKAKEYELNITLHAGEVDHSQNVLTAVDQFGAKRIGHGYHITSDGHLMKKMKEQKIHFEVCPTSSVETGGWNYGTNKNWKEHPAMIMMEHGLDIGFNSDDPAVFNTSLTWQMRIAYTKMGMEKETIWKTIINSIDAAFLSEEEKIKLKERMISFREDKEHKHHLDMQNSDRLERVVTWDSSHHDSNSDK